MLYYFHTTVAGLRSEDLEGKDFGTFEEAYADAVENGRTVLIELIQQGHFLSSSDSLEIADEEGRVRSVLPLEHLIKRNPAPRAGAKLAHAVREISDDLLTQCLAVSDTALGNVRILNTSTGQLSIRAHRGFEPEFVQNFRHLSFADASTCAAALRAHRALIVDDLASEPTLATCAEILKRAGIKAVQSTPLLSTHGFPVGVVSTHFKTPARPTDMQMQAMHAAARQAADDILKLRADLEAEEHHPNGQ